MVGKCFQFNLNDVGEPKDEETKLILSFYNWIAIDPKRILLWGWRLLNLGSRGVPF